MQIAMEELPVTLHSARVLVLGFGRLGKLAAHRMHALGAHVSVAARKWADLAWAEAYGYSAEHIEHLDGYLCPYDLVVNTVPVRVLDATRLADLRPGCLVIDLASKPGGVDVGVGSAFRRRTCTRGDRSGRAAPKDMENGTIFHTHLYIMMLRKKKPAAVGGAMEVERVYPTVSHFDLRAPTLQEQIRRILQNAAKEREPVCPPRG